MKDIDGETVETVDRKPGLWVMRGKNAESVFGTDTGSHPGPARHTAAFKVRIHDRTRKRFADSQISSCNRGRPSIHAPQPELEGAKLFAFEICVIRSPHRRAVGTWREVIFECLASEIDRELKPGGCIERQVGPASRL